MTFFGLTTDPLHALEIAYSFRLLLAAILGMLLGLERSLAGKHAGMRTYAMVSLGSALFVMLGVLASYELSIFSAVSPMHIASSVVVGIGFIGSGLAAYRSEHIEITTVSGIWMVAAIGMAVGFGFYVLSIAATMLALLIFSVFARFEYAMRVRYGVSDK